MPRKNSKGRLLLYTIFQIVMAPLVGLRFLVRFISPKTHQDFVPQAWTVPPPDPEVGEDPNTLRVVFVGPTIGEFRMMEALGKELSRRNPAVRVIYCLRDPKSLDRIRAENPEVSLGYRPVDFLPITARWSKRFRPDLLVLVEGARFPALTWTARNCGASLGLVNGRWSTRNKWHHRLRAPLFRWILGPFDLLTFPAEAVRKGAEPWAGVGQKLVTMGSLKGATLPSGSPKVRGDLSLWLQSGDNLPLLAAGSTDDLEEERMVLEAFERVRAVTPCRLLLAPRLLGRAGEVAREAELRGLRVSRRSSPAPEADVFLLDTLGELFDAYSFGQAAYVGGALRGMGHNVLEPVASLIPVAYGPARGAFEEAQLLCELHGVGTRVGNGAELASAWLLALSDEPYRLGVRAAAVEALRESEGPLFRTVEELMRLIDER